MVDSFYVFGGHTDIYDYFTTIGKLSASLVWSKVGELKNGRFGHNVIFNGSDALVIGGYKGWQMSVPTEKCKITVNGVDCTEQNPSLQGYEKYPELFLVELDFCKKQP